MDAKRATSLKANTRRRRASSTRSATAGAGVVGKLALSLRAYIDPQARDALGYAALFSDATRRHPDGGWFSPTTDFGDFGQSVPLRLEHQPGTFCGLVHLRRSKHGILALANLNNGPDSWQALRLAAQGASLFFSPGTLNTHVRIARDGRFLAFPIREVSLTVAPGGTPKLTLRDAQRVQRVNPGPDFYRALDSVPGNLNDGSLQAAITMMLGAGLQAQDALAVIEAALNRQQDLAQIARLCQAMREVASVGRDGILTTLSKLLNTDLAGVQDPTTAPPETTLDEDLRQRQYDMGNLSPLQRSRYDRHPRDERYWK